MVQRKKENMPRYVKEMAAEKAKAKKQKAEAYAKQLAFAKENPTPKLKKTMRCRMRNAVQIAECADMEMLVLCYPKCQKYFPDASGPETNQQFAEAKAAVTQHLAWKLEQRAGRPFIRPLPPPQAPVHKCRRNDDIKFTQDEVDFAMDSLKPYN